MKRPERYPYSRGAAIEGGLLVDVSELAEAEGIEFPVAVSAGLAQILEPNQFLTTFGINFEERVSNILKVLHGHFVPSPDGECDDLPGGRLVFPFIVLRGPLIKEDLISVLAVVHPGDGGDPVVTLMTARDAEQAA